MDIFNQIIPEALSVQDKNMIWEFALVIIFNARPLSTVALRNTYYLVYIVTDLVTDQLGSFVIPAITHGAVDFGIDFALNTAIGVPVVGIGISIFLAIMKYSVSKDKEEVYIPNNLVALHVKRYLRCEIEKLDAEIQLYIDSLMHVSKDYLSYPFTETRFRMLKENRKELAKRLINIRSVADRQPATSPVERAFPVAA